MKKLIIVAAFILLSGVTFGQTLQKGGVLGLHTVTLTLNPGVTMDQYQDFMNNTLIPEFEKHYQGVKFFTLKGLNRENKDEDAWVIYSKSLKDFNEYWNDDGSATDKGMAARERLQPTLDEWNKLGEYSSVITDWVIQ